MSDATTSLSTGQASGDQVTTQDPQSATTNIPAAQLSAVQPSVAANSLNSGAGVPLEAPGQATLPLTSTTVSLSHSPGAESAPAKPAMHTGALIAILVLLILAAAIFTLITRDAKKTTN